LSQSELAGALGVTPMRISQIVRGQRAITADTALRLSRYFGTRPGWWLDLQTHYDLEIAADELEVRIARTVKPCKLRPIAEPATA
jgi:addiction module HigA family antidote